MLTITNKNEKRKQKNYHQLKQKQNWGELNITTQQNYAAKMKTDHRQQYHEPRKLRVKCD
jgi:hypothetical protein